MTQVSNTASTLEQLDALSIEQAQALSFKDRDLLVDLIISDGRHEATDSTSYRTFINTLD